MIKIACVVKCVHIAPHAGIPVPYILELSRNEVSSRGMRTSCKKLNTDNVGASYRSTTSHRTSPCFVSLCIQWNGSEQDQEASHFLSHSALMASVYQIACLMAVFYNACISYFSSSTHITRCGALLKPTIFFSYFSASMACRYQKMYLITVFHNACIFTFLLQRHHHTVFSECFNGAPLSNTVVYLITVFHSVCVCFLFLP